MLGSTAGFSLVLIQTCFKPVQYKVCMVDDISASDHTGTEGTLSQREVVNANGENHFLSRDMSVAWRLSVTIMT